MENSIQLNLSLDRSDAVAIQNAINMLTALLPEGKQVPVKQLEPEKKKDDKPKKEPAAEKTEKKEKPKSEKKAPAKKEKSKQDKPKKEDAEEQSEDRTKDDLRAKWAEIRDGGGDHRDTVKEKLIELGGTSITTLPDSKIIEFYEFLESLD